MLTTIPTILSARRAVILPVLCFHPKLSVTSSLQLIRAKDSFTLLVTLWQCANPQKRREEEKRREEGRGRGREDGERQRETERDRETDGKAFGLLNRAPKKKGKTIINK